MCGIAGLWERGGASPERLRADVEAMTAALAHRGPDGESHWLEAARGIAFGHRRLSIVELSEAGTQPMTSADGRCVLTFNGEIYNHAELRAELDGVAWRGHSDTETLVEACARWGIEAVLPRLNGMFALALWDGERLWLARDRMGIKPLFWALDGEALLFGSELKALRGRASWSPLVNRQALSGFLRFGYVPAPLAIYEGAHKVPPGGLVEVTASGAPIARRWWDPRVLAPAATPGDGPPLSELLASAVKLRLMSDVPLGCLLSGGIDSSLVTALAVRAAGQRMKTFTIGFAESDHDESAYAARVAEVLGTEHRALRLSADQARALIPLLPERYDEPFSDSSALPTQLVSELARREVTVVLSGDGGDELFAGYDRYLGARRLWRLLRWVPAPVRALGGGAVRTIPPRALDVLFAPLRRQLRGLPGDRLHKIAGFASQRSLHAMYRLLVSQWWDPAALLPGVEEPMTAVTDPELMRALPRPIDWMSVVDQLTYLPDDILTKVDRASMAYGLEARVPLLDHRVVERSWTMTPEEKLIAGKGKQPLRALLAEHVPRELFERPKQGFAIPLGEWLRGPLRDWAESLLDERSLRDGGLEPAPIRRCWAEHVSGRRRWHYQVWVVLMWQAWRARWM